MGICEQVRKKDQEHERLSNKKVEPDQNRFTWFTHSEMVVLDLGDKEQYNFFL